jgi:hypothetical protein
MKASHLVWDWWDRDEPEEGFLGFHTKKDRDDFSAGKAGPFRRRLSADGRTISQLATWADWIKEAEDKLKE